MTARLVGVFRHPIKGIGRESLEHVDMMPGAPLPGDRAWALLHEGGADTNAWQPRRNFLVVASGPKLAQIGAQTLDETITVSHPDLPELTFDAATGGDALIRWVTPLWPTERPAPKRLVRAPATGMADHSAPQVSILNLASLRALSQKTGQALEVERFRGNLILDGLPPWAEFDWIGRSIRIGAVTFDVTDRIERCRATEASPKTGTRNANPLRALEDGWNHRDFGVLATVQTAGRLTLGDKVVE